jgi:hypothetical protein
MTVRPVRAVDDPALTDAAPQLTVETLASRTGMSGAISATTTHAACSRPPNADGLYEAPSPARLRAAEEVLAR